MRTIVTAFWLGLAALTAQAQVVPQGATPDAVIRALGAPRSRSAAREREIWLYPDFQVVFENGRLTSLLALPADGATIEWQKRPGPTPAAVTVPAPSGKTSGPVILSQESGKRVLRSPERRPVVPPPPGWWSRFWPALMMMGIAGALIVAWLRAKRKRRPPVDLAAIPTRAEKSGPPSGRRPETDSRSPHVPKPPSLGDWELPLDVLRSLEWRRFELLVERTYAATGIRAKSTGVGADGGVELYLYRGKTSRPYGYVQCHGWGQRQISLEKVQELFRIMTANRVPQGTLVTTGRFTSEAVTFARKNRIALLDGDEVVAWFNRQAPLVRSRILEEITKGDFTTPTCPRCSSKLVTRDSDQEPARSWSCRRYPQCHYTLKIGNETATSPMGAPA